jgi:SAM-dependent methyltransferase
LEFAFDASTRHSFWRKYSDAVNHRLLSSWRPPAARDILKTDAFDEACTGGLVDWVDLGYQTVTAIDIAPTVVRRAAANAPRIRTSCADVRSLPFRDSSFDWIISTSTLDHFANAEEISVSLNELFRVLRPGGELLLTLDNPVNPFVALRNILPGRLSQSAGLSSYDVGVTLTPWRLRQEVVRSGFVVTDSTTIGQCPRAAAVLVAGMMSSRRQSAILRFALACEKLSTLPSRVLTGHFSAIRALKPSHP